MGLRFRRRVKICPGLYLNFSTGGASITAGVPGASVNVGPNGTFLNAGIPGTGIYSRERISQPDQQVPEPPPLAQSFATGGEIKSGEVEALTSMELAETKAMILKAISDCEELEARLSAGKRKLFWLKLQNALSKVFLIGFLVRWFGRQVEGQLQLLGELEARREECVIHLNCGFDEATARLYEELSNAFGRMSNSSKTWDKTSSSAVNMAAERSSASSAIKRNVVKFGFGDFPVIKSDKAPFYFENSNGPDIFIYPAFIVLKSGNSIALLGFKDIQFDYSRCSFVEEEFVPSDAERIGTTWKKCNKDGGPDRRFKGNYEIPIVQYGEFFFRSDTGVDECFVISNFEATKDFGEAFLAYQRTMVVSR